MKKYAFFTVFFVFAFVVLQVLSGMFLTIFYTPSGSWEKTAAISYQTELSGISVIPTLIIALIALGAAFGATKLFSKIVLNNMK